MAFPGDEAAIEGGEARAAAAGAERGHVEDAADGAAALGDDALAALEPAVLGDGRDADQAGDLAPVEAAEFGQLGKQRGRQDQADARHAGQQGKAAGEAGRAAKGAAQQRLDLGLVAPQAGEIGLRAPPEQGRLEMAELLLPGGDLADQPLTEGQQLGKLAQGGVRRRRRWWPGEGAVAAITSASTRSVPGSARRPEDKLGQSPARLGEVAHPLGVDDRDLEAALEQAPMRQALVAARCLHDHQPARACPGRQPGDPGRIIPDPQTPTRAELIAIDLGDPGCDLLLRPGRAQDGGQRGRAHHRHQPQP